MDKVTEYIRKWMAKLSKKDIIIDEHAFIRMIQRQIDSNEVKENIINSAKLIYAEEIGSNRYDCYFNRNKKNAHRYIIFKKKKKCIIRSVMNINRGLQRKVEKKYGKG